MCSPVKSHLPVSAYWRPSGDARTTGPRMALHRTALLKRPLFFPFIQHKFQHVNVLLHDFKVNSLSPKGGSKKG